MKCSKCGGENRDSAVFCHHCGEKIEETIQKENKITKSFDFKAVLNWLKAYFLDFYVDYNSKFFKYGMAIFLSIGIGEALFRLVNFICQDFHGFFLGAFELFNILTCVLLFGVFSILILKLKRKPTIKRSNFLMIFWLVSVVLNILVFITSINLYQYILYSYYATAIVEILMVISSALLIFKNKQKYPFVLMVSAFSFALTKSALWVIKLDIELYKIFEKRENLIDIIYSMEYIILVAAVFLLVYIFPRKLSKWLVYIPTLFFTVLKFIRLIDGFLFIDIPGFIIEISIFAAFVLLALSCSRKIEYEYVIENKEKTRKSAVKVGVISTITIAVIVVTYLLVSAIVCGTQINKGIEKWKMEIIYGDLNDSAEWSEMNNDIFKNDCTKFVSQFVDDYSFYETLKENRYKMEKIALCYSAYQDGSVDEDIINEYSYMSIKEDWENDSVLSRYYEKYMEMKPDIKNVTVKGYVDVSKGKIEVKVINNNVMPLSKCTVNCKFTILFVEAGYYSDNEYGRGSKTIVVNNIGGNSEKTEIISFDPDNYYESYGSYILTSLVGSTTEIISIE